MFYSQFCEASSQNFSIKSDVLKLKKNYTYIVRQCFLLLYCYIFVYPRQVFIPPVETATESSVWAGGCKHQAECGVLRKGKEVQRCRLHQVCNT